MATKTTSKAKAAPRTTSTRKSTKSWDTMTDADIYREVKRVAAANHGDYEKACKALNKSGMFTVRGQEFTPRIVATYVERR